MADNDKKVIARELPHNIEAEEALLGALIIDDEVVQDSMPEIQEEFFYSQTNKIVFKAIKEIYNKNMQVDLVTLTDTLSMTQSLNKIGGIDFITKLTTQIASTANVKQYLDIVKRDGLKRQLIRTSTGIIDNCYEMEEGSEILTYAEGEIFGLSMKNTRNFPTDIGDSINVVLEKFDMIAKNKDAYRGVPTGIKVLDDTLNGLGKSDLVLIAARPSDGKTSLAMNIVEHAGVVGKATCVVFSLEMSKEQIAQRMILSASKVKMKDAITGNLDYQQWEELWKAKSVLSGAKILIDDTPSITPQDMLSKCRRIKSKEGKLDLIMVDYIQLMSGGNKKLEGNRQQEISEISRKLKLIAREMECPLIALSQLSRMVESRKPPKPQLSDLRDSGAIEQDADVVIFIYNPEKAVVGADGGQAVTGVGTSGLRQLLIAKNRNGAVKDVDVRWIADQVRFADLDGYVKENKDTNAPPPEVATAFDPETREGTFMGEENMAEQEQGEE